MELACVPGLFAEEAVHRFHPMLGNGILIPAACAERVIDETVTELMAVFSMTVNSETHYMTLAGYSHDEYTYIPGSLLGDDFNPGELVTLDFVKNVGHAGALYLDCDWFDNAKEILERTLGDIYRVVYPGMVIKTDDGHEYHVKKISNCHGVDIPVGLAIDTDMEIIFREPDRQVSSVNEPDTCQVHTTFGRESPGNTEEHRLSPDPMDDIDPSPEERKPTLAELRAMRLAYFNKTH